MEALLRRVEQVGLVTDEHGHDRRGMTFDGRIRTAGEMAALVVDAVLGQEETA